MKATGLFIAVLMFTANVIQAQVSKTIFVNKAGTLISQLTEDEANSITHLTLTGKINAIDFKHLRNEFESLQVLDISNADIRLYSGKEGTHADKFYIYPPNCIPAYAFCRVVNGDTIGKSSLIKVILSEKLKNIEDGAFKKCNNLQVCQINKKTAPNLLEDGLSDAVTAVFVPYGTRDDYRLKKRWENFAVLEGDPITIHLQIGQGETLRDGILKAGLQPKEINFLTIEGKLDNEDMKLIRDYMPNLVSVDITKTTVTDIPDFIFAQKKYLIRIVLPEQLRSLGQRVFSGCGRLSGVLELPETVTTIGYGTFMNCDNLTKVVAKGDKLTAIGSNLFGDANSRLVIER
ncbi:leucine-rich repeat domain-containing protein [Bacteroides sp. 214]|uniref:leucine-rich repeat protein n=1 Tax=Bacteroides sp. 214 TaxID=2302935 RepID=UPI0013D7D141|nr:leucine-rich repeat domain-containing protein [Bacteroides sp. 214]NDW11573.1 leucine-rich repeat domain-containing protein [Bacteroides sp. 214]